MEARVAAATCVPARQPVRAAIRSPRLSLLFTRSSHLNGRRFSLTACTKRSRVSSGPELVLRGRLIVRASASTPAAAPELAPTDRRIPITVLTGFLGSGKTTTLNNILTKEHGRRIAIIENEFGEIDIDSKLVAFQDNSQEQIMMLNNGCLCCTVRGDLVNMIFKLCEERRDEFDHVVIETTGLANPAPVIQTFTDEDMSQLVRLDGVVTVVDAKHISRHLDAGDKQDSPNEALEQLAYADRIILNKTDLVGPQDLKDLEVRIKAINAMADIKQAERGNVDVDFVLGVGGFDLDKVEQSLEPKSAHNHDHSECDHDHGHCEHEKSVDSHSHDHGHCAHEKSVDSHSHDHSECDHDHGHCAHDHDHHDHAHSHGLHNDAVTSVNTWLGSLLEFRGEDIYRMKGILAIGGYDRRFVFQGVHMMFDGNPDRAWQDGEERKSQIVFIGRDLDREILEEGFKKCQLKL